MARHVLSVCVFCFICATHSPCASHAVIGDKGAQRQHWDPNGQPLPEAADRDKSENSTAMAGEELKKIFAMYGDGENMKMEGFERLMKNLLGVVMPNKSEEVATNYGSQMCIDRDNVIAALVSPTSAPNNRTLKAASCLATLYSIVAGDCSDNDETQVAAHFDHEEGVVVAGTDVASVWFFSNLAVLIISLCGVLGLAVIPIMQKRYYQQLLQFLVALAVGTLAGDALLHLLPHAMNPEHEGHSHGSTMEHDENMWKGFTAMLGLMFFFVMERIILFVARWRKRSQLRQMENSRVKIIKQIGNDSRSREKQCVNKYSSFPLCYNDIINTPNNVKIYSDTELDTTATTLGLDQTTPETNQNHIADCPNDHSAETNGMLLNHHNHNHEDKENNDYTVILREHESRHHGHSHAHGHVHAAPKTMSSVAWMVIMGDGLHNFTDGMAIGAAFSGSVAGGFSTAVAVFCHELPHELGDFAMLLKAGMTMKQALFYNLLSSVLCIIGNIVGVVLGNTQYASSWVFAMAAGMFIYIALVDMIPELSSAHEDEGDLLQFFLHFGGLATGVAIMTLIALYEHDLKHIFKEP